MTAATELGTNTWIVGLLQGAGVSGITHSCFHQRINGFGKVFCRPGCAQAFNPNGMLILSALLACIGLFLLSRATGYAAFGAAFVLLPGICFSGLPCLVLYLNICLTPAH